MKDPNTPPKMLFYTFTQNNSGGQFYGPAHYVIVEAPSANVADAIAEDNGLYFDGIASGQDCYCCGDRWSRTWAGDATRKPEVYGETDLSKVDKSCRNHHIPVVKVFYMDGMVQTFGVDKVADV
jgi:hypothetical protein